MFVDKAQVSIQAGNGGDGLISFRHEKFVDKGGPDGGDGGKGGDVIFEGSRNQNTLASFRYQKELKAPSGAPGGKRNRHGKNGSDLVIKVPLGTAVMNEDGQTVADLTADGQQVVVAKGGNGGFGNAHFVSSTRQTPRMAEKGEMGDAFKATLELKMIADVGLIGLPNAGKSTLLAALSNARPEIADYPFTTLRPNLGVVDVDKKRSLLMADIPGLIEGASEGKGLGDDFLRHVERTAVLLHLIDAYQEDVASAYKTIQDELKAYKVDLTSRPEVVALTKIEGLDQDIVNDQLERLKKVVPAGVPVLAMSAAAKMNIPELLYKVAEVVDKEKEKQQAIETEKPSVPVITLTDKTDTWKVSKQDDGSFIVTGRKIERFASRTDFDNPQGVRRLRDIMRKMGIMHELTRQGIAPEAKIKIAKVGKIQY